MSRRDDAEAFEIAGRWAEAGETWRALAEEHGAAGRRGQAAEAATRAADAFRRDDRPAASARMLRFSLERRQATVRDAVLLAGALLDTGEIDAAVQIARAAAEGAPDDSARALALDVFAGSLLASGRVNEARPPIGELARGASASSRMAAAFRQAQLARLDGDLRAAEAQWRALAAQLRPHPAAAGALAATWMDLGETAVLRVALRGIAWFPESDAPEVDEAEAEACFAQASAAWARAGRRAGYLRAEAWRARLRDAGGPGPPPTFAATLETAVAYADERGLVGMAAEMRVARAIVRRSPLDALHAAELAKQAPLARGRARVVAAELGGPFQAELALAELALDVPWRARAERARGGFEA